MDNSNKNIKFDGVPSEYLELTWQSVEPYLTRALARGGQYRTVDVLKKLITKEMQLWIAYFGEYSEPDVQAFCITEINVTPLQRECIIFACSGKERDNWQHYIKTIEVWAKSKGCQSVRINARPGWERVLKTYKKTHSLLEKVL